MTIKLPPMPFIRRNSITKWRFLFIQTLPFSFSSCLSMFLVGCMTVRSKSSSYRLGVNLRLGAGVGVSQILHTPAPTQSPVKTIDSNWLQLRSRLQLRRPGHFCSIFIYWPYLTWPWPLVSIRSLLIWYLLHSLGGLLAKFGLSAVISPVRRWAYRAWKWWRPVRHRWSSGACDRCWSTVADLMSYGNCVTGLEKARIPRNEDEPGYTRFHASFAGELTRLWLPLFSYQTNTVSTFSSGENVWIWISELCWAMLKQVTIMLKYAEFEFSAYFVIINWLVSLILRSGNSMESGVWQKWCIFSGGASIDADKAAHHLRSTRFN